MSNDTLPTQRPTTRVPAVSIVVPTYQEAENLDELVTRVSWTLDRLEMLYEIIVVDDHSDDGTDREIARLRAAGHPVKLIQRREERGLSSAVLCGFSESRGDWLVCMDADLSHPPEALPRLLEPIRRAEAELVIGSRYVPGATTDERWGLLRRLNSRVATLLARPFTRLKDPLAGFFALPRSVFQRTTQWDPIGYKIGLEILVKTGCRQVHEVPIHFADRQRGKSKLSWREQCNYLRHLLRLASFKFGGYWQFAVYSLVGASGAIVDLTSFAALLRAHVPLSAARGAAILLALTWNFLGNEHVTFRQPPCGRWKRFLQFTLACGLGATLNYLTTLLGVSISSALAERPLATAILGIAIGTVSNFLLARSWVFTSHGRRVSDGPT